MSVENPEQTLLRRDYGNHSSNHLDFAASWRITNLAIQCWLGLLSIRYRHYFSDYLAGPLTDWQIIIPITFGEAISLCLAPFQRTRGRGHARGRFIFCPNEILSLLKNEK